MNSLVFILVMFILSLVFDKLKQARVKTEELPKKKKKVKISTGKVSSNNPRIKEEPLERKPRVIVDREKEIVSKLEEFDFDDLWEGFFGKNISASLLKLFLKYLI